MKTLLYPDYFKLSSDWTEFFYNDKMEMILTDVTCDLPETTYNLFKWFYTISLNDVNIVWINTNPTIIDQQPTDRLNYNLQLTYKELEKEGFYPFKDGNLEHLHRQGVLFLDLSLSPDNNQSIWFDFVVEVIKKISEKKVIWLLFNEDNDEDIYEKYKKYMKGSIYETSYSSLKDSDIFKKINKELGDKKLTW